MTKDMPTDSILSMFHQQKKRPCVARGISERYQKRMYSRMHSVGTQLRTIPSRHTVHKIQDWSWALVRSL